MLARVIIIAYLLAHDAQGWEILTATLDPPTTPILEGEDVTAKVTCIIKQTLDKIYSHITVLHMYLKLISLIANSFRL